MNFDPLIKPKLTGFRGTRMIVPRQVRASPDLGGSGSGSGAWRSLVAHLLWEQRVGGSNPSAPTSHWIQRTIYKGVCLSKIAPVAQLDRASAFKCGACIGKLNRCSGLHYNGETLTGNADGNPVETFGRPIRWY